MKRSELYAKVWSIPMVRAASELGISDVGLSKACKRHAVPVPPRGYWAKLAAGQRPTNTPLPAPELDVPVEFARSDPEERERKKRMTEEHAASMKSLAEQAQVRVNATFLEDLSNAHPLVKTTQKYVERIPKLVQAFERRGAAAHRGAEKGSR